MSIYKKLEKELLNKKINIDYNLIDKISKLSYDDADIEINDNSIKFYLKIKDEFILTIVKPFICDDLEHNEVLFNIYKNDNK